jgi:hypothetical protein
MNRDDIIRMAREAGCDIAWADSLERFAALVAAAERERLAKALDHQCRGMSDYFEVKWIRELATALRRNQ